VTTTSKRDWSEDPLLIFSAAVLMFAGIMRLYDAVWAFQLQRGQYPTTCKAPSSATASRPTPGSGCSRH
jgi:hypothetical protein